MKFVSNIYILLISLILVSSCAEEQEKPETVQERETVEKSDTTETVEKAEKPKKRKPANKSIPVETNVKQEDENENSYEGHKRSDVFKAKDLFDFIPDKFRNFEIETASSGTASYGTGVTTSASLYFNDGDKTIYARISDHGSKENNPDHERLQNLPEDRATYTFDRIMGDEYFGFSKWHTRKEQGFIYVNYLDSRFNIYAEVSNYNALRGSEKEFIESFKLKELKERVK